MALEIDDDVFYADLSKQISLLIMDDDDDDDDYGVQEFPIQNPPLHLQGFHYMPQAIMPPPYTYEMAYRSREISKGTGVFIPRSSFPRRKNRPAKSNSTNNNNNSSRSSSSHKQLDKSRVAVSRSSQYANSSATKNQT